jgi:hypothetical protein
MRTKDPNLIRAIEPHNLRTVSAVTKAILDDLAFKRATGELTIRNAHEKRLNIEILSLPKGMRP